ncbi:hypothetical protein ACU686_24115 [Yinghuangia aomiensis]
MAEAVRLTSAARRIDIVGVGASAVIALDLGRSSTASGPSPTPGTTRTPHHRGGPARPGRRRHRRLAHRRHARHRRRHRRAAARGAHTIALTSAPIRRSPALADVLLTTAGRETTFRSGATASRIAALSVVDVLFAAVAQRNYDRAISALEITRRAVVSRRADIDEGPLGGRPHVKQTRIRVISPTEEVNTRTHDLDIVPTLELVRLINAEDDRVPGAVAAVLPELAALVDVSAARVEAGGRVHYFRSRDVRAPRRPRRGRTHPTFGSTGTVVAHQAGGARAFVTAVEDAEDVMDGTDTDDIRSRTSSSASRPPAARPTSARP